MEQFDSPENTEEGIKGLNDALCPFISELDPNI